MPKSGRPFKLEITQKELVENGIVAWGTRAFLDYLEYSFFRAHLLLKNSHNFIHYFI
jgi:hypothetical protein